MRRCWFVLTRNSVDFVLAGLVSHPTRLLLHQHLVDAWMVGLRNAENFKIAQSIFPRLFRLVQFLVVLVGDFVEVLVVLQIEFLVELHNFLLVLVGS